MVSKFPPYGRHLMALRPRDIQGGEVRVYVGDGPTWEHAKNRDAQGLPVLVLPPDTTPDRYAWPVSGWQVLIIQLGAFPAEVVPRLAYQLLKASAWVVRAAVPGSNVLVYGGERVAA